ncbi:MAG: uracil-DNA glycosylase [Deltaproteobacteria bacterium]|nr:uracil-DNA glycosylase [Deltaproteobacteria bacterium]
MRAAVEELRATGVAGFPPGGITPAPATRNEPPTIMAAGGGDQATDAHPSLAALRAEIGDCQRCKLHQGRTHLVFGVGNPNAEIMFVGEGPGQDEDLQGEPFVGRAGQLLTEIITKGMKMRRADVYIANVVKCRPPNNRNPEPEEIAACEPFLLRQIECIRPRVLVALGKFAAQTLLRETTPITRLRGRWFDYHGIKLMPTFHPAYLLRNPADKKLVWEDIKQVLAEVGRPL